MKIRELNVGLKSKIFELINQLVSIPLPNELPLFKSQFTFLMIFYSIIKGQIIYN